MKSWNEAESILVNPYAEDFWRTRQTPRMKSDFGWFAMRNVNHQGWEKPVEYMIPTPKAFGQIANDLCEKALKDAKEQLHPLLRDVELSRLEKRPEFIKTFKRSLEQRIARKLAGWYPGIETVFQYDETRTENPESWDGSIHLLAKVPRLSDTLKILGRRLDRSLVKYIRQLNWPRFQKHQSILEVQQVTLSELRHGIGYGAMFHAVYTVPVKVWPQDKKHRL
jgi:hypothetical protein